MLCAKLKYQGDLLDISDIFTTDIAKFIKVSKIDPKEGHIELLQRFDPDAPFMSLYDIYVPIKPDLEDNL